MKLAEKKTLLQLDIALCRATGDLGAAMKHAVEVGDTELYDQLRQKRIEVSTLRDALNETR